MLPRGAHHDIDDASSTDGSSGFDKGLFGSTEGLGRGVAAAVVMVFRWYY